jgi:hypothetical protein
LTRSEGTDPSYDLLEPGERVSKALGLGRRPAKILVGDRRTQLEQVLVDTGGVDPVERARESIPDPFERGEIAADPSRVAP